MALSLGAATFETRGVRQNKRAQRLKRIVRTDLLQVMQIDSSGKWSQCDEDLWLAYAVVSANTQLQPHVGYCHKAFSQNIGSFWISAPPFSHMNGTTNGVRVDMFTPRHSTS